MALLYGRQCRLTVGERVIGPSILSTTTWHYTGGAGLRIAFDLKKALESSANAGRIVVYNLSATSRNSLKKGQQVTLEAGYESGMSVVFSGQIRAARSVLTGTEWVTTLIVTDSADVMLTGLSVVLAAGSDVRLAMLDVAKQLAASGVDTGEAVARITAEPPKVTANGISKSGTLKEIAKDLTAVFGKKFSIQDNKLQLLDVEPGNRATFTTTALVALNPVTGLLSPLEVLDDPDGEKDGWIKANALMVGAITPGAAAAVESPSIIGLYRVETCTFTGDTHGDPWGVAFEGRPI